MESAIDENNSIPTTDEVFGSETNFEPVSEEQPEATLTSVRTYVPSAPIEMREKSTRIRKPPDRLNLVAEKLPISTSKEGTRGEWSLMTVTRALKQFSGQGHRSHRVRGEITTGKGDIFWCAHGTAITYSEAEDTTF